MEITYSDDESRSLWMVAQQDIDAHLVFLAVDVELVAVTVADVVVHGKVGVLQANRLVPFHPDPQSLQVLTPPPVRSPVRVDYAGPSDSYTFHTRLVDVVDGCWLLSPPRSIERSDRRIVFRHRALGAAGIDLRVEGNWLPPGARQVLVFDISTDGVAFLFDPALMPVADHDILMGALQVSTGFVSRLTLHVAHVRLLQPDGPQHLAGARFLDISLEERQALAQAVSRWELARKRGGG